jgi:hypothetical protein
MSYWQCMPQWLLLWRDSGGLFGSRTQRNPQGHPNVHHRPVSSVCCMNHSCFSFHVEHWKWRNGWMNEYGLWSQIVMTCHSGNDVWNSGWTPLLPLFPMCPRLAKDATTCLTVHSTPHIVCSWSASNLLCICIACECSTHYANPWWWREKGLVIYFCNMPGNASIMKL